MRNVLAVGLIGLGFLLAAGCGGDDKKEVCSCGCTCGDGTTPAITANAEAECETQCNTECGSTGYSYTWQCSSMTE